MGAGAAPPQLCPAPGGHRGGGETRRGYSPGGLRVGLGCAVWGARGDGTAMGWGLGDTRGWHCNGRGTRDTGGQHHDGIGTGDQGGTAPQWDGDRGPWGGQHCNGLGTRGHHHKGTGTTGARCSSRTGTTRARHGSGTGTTGPTCELVEAELAQGVRGVGVVVEQHEERVLLLVELGAADDAQVLQRQRGEDVHGDQDVARHLPDGLRGRDGDR